MVPFVKQHTFSCILIALYKSIKISAICSSPLIWLLSIQRRAARFCYNDFSRSSSVTRMMSSINLPTLEERRNRSKLTTTYKIISGNLSIPTNDLIPNQRPSRDKQLNTVIDSYKFSFFLLQSNSGTHSPSL